MPGHVEINSAAIAICFIEALNEARPIALDPQVRDAVNLCIVEL
jgi:hypothetical protein